MSNRHDVRPESLTLGANPWEIPSAENALDCVFEGMPSDDRCQMLIARALKARENWKPSDEAMDVVEKLNLYIGWRAQIEFWHPISMLLDDEGPNPIQAVCKGVVFRLEEGFIQAYICLTNFAEIKTEDGMPASNFVTTGTLGCDLLASVDKIIRIKPIEYCGLD